MNMKVLCKCGHTGTVDLFGSDESQDKRIAELELSDCTMCWLKKKHPYFSIRISKEFGIVMSGHDCYSIRETLRERGYYFARPAWRKKLADEADRDVELQWIADQGYPMAEIKEKTPQEIRKRKKKAQKNRAPRAPHCSSCGCLLGREYASHLPECPYAGDAAKV